MLRREKYPDILSRFADKNVLVIGDLILDVYLHGVSRRLSPEAPVPVVDVVKKISMPGGAGNVACNLVSLGAHVTCCTVVGDDDDGIRAERLLQRAGVNTSPFFFENGRSTMVKTRIMASDHIVTRFDVGNESPLNAQIEANLIAYIVEHFEDFDAVIISDYNKGTITSSVIETIAAHRSRCHYLAVDSKRLSLFAKTRPTLVKPNYDETIDLIHVPYDYQSRVAQVIANRENILEQTNADIVAVTLDQQGSVILERPGSTHTLKAPRIELPFVSGAGDTYVSAYVLASLAGADAKLSGELATDAATIVVKKRDTGFCSCAELLEHRNGTKKYMDSLEDAIASATEYHDRGFTIVFVNGCFDIIHSGHVSFLNQAKRLGDILIVGVNTDDSISRLKGEERPINRLSDRVEVLAGLAAVDHVISFGSPSDDTPITLIKAIRPHILAKGEDYAGRVLPEQKVIDDVGCKVVYVSYVADHSTTAIINKIQRHSVIEQ
jgi:D-beta-D-heptose 7-phosphate kinase/D-beta-D-heptose 1-phosphate adenosyltransferase